MKIAVIDGLGGGLGSQIIASLKKEIEAKKLKEIDIIALGTNSGATRRMIDKGADQGASGENAVKVMAKKVDIIAGPLGIIIPNSMLGEITQSMAEAIVDSPARVFLLGNKQSHVEMIGLQEKSINELTEELVKRIKEYINDVNL